MVHPYRKAREQPDQVVYACEALKEALKRTLGAPVFQAQVMQISMLAVSFSAGESDSLRRSMVERGDTPAFAETIFKRMEGFGDYGFS